MLCHDYRDSVSAAVHADAMRYCYQAIEQGDIIEQIFLYQDAVFLATQTDHQWLDFARSHHLTINVCINAANRRGIKTVQAPFAMVGMLEYFACIAADRSISSVQF